MKITLCGSTKYREAFEHANRELSKAGHIVYSVSSYGHSGDELSEAEKIILDLVHLRKIVESDAILVVGGEGLDLRPGVVGAGVPYLGFSTARERDWARMWGKPAYTSWHADEGENAFK